MAAIKEYKCPCCGGAVEFDSKIQKIKCPYCDTEFDTEAFTAHEEEAQNAKPDEMDWETTAGGAWEQGEESTLRSYVCNSCGGEIVCDENTAAQRHYKGKKLLPKIFKKENHIDEIKGVYVPFWLFDADADADIRYKATRVRTWSDSDYDYTETSYYSIGRSGDIGFDRVPVDGSSKMPDDLMESIEPFKFEDAVDFKTAYLAGYLADKYDVTAEQSIDRANERIKRSTEDAFASTVKGYHSVTTENSSIRLHNGKAKYALYPVWLLNTTWKGKKYLFAMNGQTGKFVGDLPVDNGLYFKWLGGLTAGFGVIALIAYFLFWLF